MKDSKNERRLNAGDPVLVLERDAMTRKRARAMGVNRMSERLQIEGKSDMRIAAGRAR